MIVNDNSLNCECKSDHGSGHMILPRLILSDQEFVDDERNLITYNVQTILSFRELGTNFISHIGNTYKYDYHRFCVGDAPSQHILYLYEEQSFGLIDAVLSCRNNNYSVLVHCYAGVSRSATIVIAYVMKSLSMTFQVALQFVSKKRNIINPNDGFRNQLMSFSTHLQTLWAFEYMAIVSALNRTLCQSLLPLVFQYFGHWHSKLDQGQNTNEP